MEGGLSVRSSWHSPRTVDAYGGSERGAEHERKSRSSEAVGVRERRQPPREAPVPHRAHGFFPADAFGPSSAKAGTGKPVRLEVEGLAVPVVTDIPTDARTGRTRKYK